MPLVGLEPTARPVSRLSVLHHCTLVLEGGLLYQLSYRGKNGGLGGTRTRNLTLKRRLL